MNRCWRRVVLASRSPRRRALLETACVPFLVQPVDVDESWPGGSSEEGAVTLARRKLDALGSRVDPALAADTVVVLDERPLGKPRDEQDAVGMLTSLSGREHRVVTGICLQDGVATRELAVSTRVWFRSLSQLEIERYVSSGEPLDKAGAYAIQGAGGSFVARIEGSYTNVVGLPLAEVLAAMEAMRWMCRPG